MFLCLSDKDFINRFFYIEIVVFEQLYNFINLSFTLQM